ncbi:NAD-dependent epimerase/dehydratase family protein [Actinosynnema sp. NPDC020468]|uniref:NAD-dependent epimerase/dehydratase family protein n=1 Tax=Actinosynnema sp. NPDC020468 TaxID=3154488 RepID=UPI0033BFDA21
MRVILFGGTGMVGQGVLRECLLDSDVDGVLAVGRGPLGVAHPKLTELRHADFTDFSTVATELTGYDACFFCLGVSSVGRSAQAYEHVTYDFTLAAARVLAEVNPGSVFGYVSGAGTDGGAAWAKVKKRVEDDVIALPLRGYAFRPGYIQPRHGVRPKVRWYRWVYAALTPVYPLLARLLPRFTTTTGQLGRAMLSVAKHGSEVTRLESVDINRR